MVLPNKIKQNTIDVYNMYLNYANILNIFLSVLSLILFSFILTLDACR